MNNKAVVVLEDGRIFEGKSYAKQGVAFGELVFTTGMTGYQETLTDPSYAGQIIMHTAPHIGNTGINKEDEESRKIWAAGYVVRDGAEYSSNWRSEKSLHTELEQQNIVGIQGVDTRALTRHIRTQGSLQAGIFSGHEFSTDTAALVKKVKENGSCVKVDLLKEVTHSQPYTLGNGRFKVAALDLGIKNNTPRLMAQRDLSVHIFPATATSEEIFACEPDGIFFSNGPGNPATADAQVKLLQEVLRRKIPFFGICFGHQLLGRALGFTTYKLKYGHRGINIPVKNIHRHTIEITSQNHGFAVDAPLQGVHLAPHKEFGKVEVSHICLNDNVVEGLRCVDLPAFSVQFHPEAAAGPHDSAYLFDDFVTMIEENTWAHKKK